MKCREDLRARSKELIPLREAMIKRYISEKCSSEEKIKAEEDLEAARVGDGGGVDGQLDPGAPHPDPVRSQALKLLLDTLVRRHGAIQGGGTRKKKYKKSKRKKKISKKKISKKKRSKKRTRRR
tara:strand:- start:1010 stop:1381 length:372 start_codon:yes stop_codon:yes gene_type:complete